MSTLPMPSNTVPNITGAICDLMRASAVYGADVATAGDQEFALMLVAQYAVQLLALVLQRDPTDDEKYALLAGFLPAAQQPPPGTVPAPIAADTPNPTEPQ